MITNIHQVYFTGLFLDFNHVMGEVKRETERQKIRVINREGERERERERECEKIRRIWEQGEEDDDDGDDI